MMPEENLQDEELVEDALVEEEDEEVVSAIKENLPPAPIDLRRALVSYVPLVLTIGFIALALNFYKGEMVFMGEAPYTVRFTSEAVPLEVEERGMRVSKWPAFYNMEFDKRGYYLDKQRMKLSWRGELIIEPEFVMKPLIERVPYRSSLSLSNDVQHNIIDFDVQGLPAPLVDMDRLPEDLRRIEFNLGGDHALLWHGGSISLWNEGGDALRTFPAERLSIAWSADGEELVWFEKTDEGGEIYSSSLDDLDSKKLVTTFKDVSGVSLSWSEDKKRLAVIPFTDLLHRDVYIVDMDAKKKQRMTNTGGAMQVLFLPGGSDFLVQRVKPGGGGDATVALVRGGEEIEIPYITDLEKVWVKSEKEILAAVYLTGEEKDLSFGEIFSDFENLFDEEQVRGEDLVVFDLETMDKWPLIRDDNLLYEVRALAFTDDQAMVRFVSRDSLFTIQLAEM